MFFLDYLPAAGHAQSPALKQQQDWRRWEGMALQTGGTDQSYADELTLVGHPYQPKTSARTYLSGCQPLRQKQQPHISQSLSQTCTCDQIQPNLTDTKQPWECGRVAKVTFQLLTTPQDNSRRLLQARLVSRHQHYRESQAS